MTRPPVPVQPIERTRVAEAVRDQLLALVESGELPVGSRLPSEHELARSFGVSRPVVREALGSLRSVGIIESRTGSGSFVRATTATHSGLLLAGRFSSDELHEVRCEIEIPGAGAAAVRRTEEHLAVLQAIVAGHNERRSVEEWVRDDLRFHVTLAEATGNRLQVRLVSELRELQSELSLTMARMAGGLDAPFDEHSAIVDAIGRRDPDGGRSAMRDHLAAIQQRSQALGGRDAG